VSAGAAGQRLFEYRSSPSGVLGKSTIFDIFGTVDTKELGMSKLFSKTKDMAISFCERCGQACGSACRADALRERARMQALASGWRQA
jgi:ferredoxin